MTKATPLNLVQTQRKGYLIILLGAQYYSSSDCLSVAIELEETADLAVKVFYKNCYRKRAELWMELAVLLEMQENAK